MPQLLIELYSEEIPAGLQEAGAKILEKTFAKIFPIQNKILRI